MIYNPTSSIGIPLSSSPAPYFSNNELNWLGRELGSKNVELKDAMAAEQREFAFNAKEAQKNRDFQAEMSNTSYQRGIKDLIASGLNPILAATMGGASTPSGATASGSAKTASGSKGMAASVLPMVISAFTSLASSKIAAQAKITSAEIAADASVKKSTIANSQQINRRNSAKAVKDEFFDKLPDWYAKDSRLQKVDFKDDSDDLIDEKTWKSLGLK